MAELLLSIHRTGVDIILTCFAKDSDQILFFIRRCFCPLTFQVGELFLSVSNSFFLPF